MASNISVGFDYYLEIRRKTVGTKRKCPVLPVLKEPKFTVKMSWFLDIECLTAMQ